jgi:purine-cytosine permease-like protein
MTNDRQNLDSETPPIAVEIDPEQAHSPSEFSQQVRAQMLQFQSWFEKLPIPIKALVVIALVSVSLSLLTKVLHFLASLLSVIISATFLYLLYRFVLKPALNKDT